MSFYHSEDEDSDMSDIDDATSSRDEVNNQPIQSTQQPVSTALLQFQAQERLRIETQEMVIILVGQNIAAMPLVVDMASIHAFAEAAKHVIRFKKLERGRASNRILPKHWDLFKKLLWFTFKLPKLTPKIYGFPINLKNILEDVVKPDSGFDKVPHTIYLEIARALLKYYNACDWNGALEITQPEKFSTAQRIKRTTKQRAPKATSGNTSTKKSKSKVDKSKIRRPNSDHPIYGDNGIMRGMLWRITDNGKPSTCTNPDYKSEFKSCKVSGANGLQNGDWFPRTLAAKRDGAHHLHQAGIAGASKDGAHSIIVSDGEYENVDMDLGSTINYSAPGGGATTSNTPNGESKGAMLLTKSIETGKPVRVLRGSTRWTGSPACGYRYDGLYQVVGKELKRNENEGTYFSFKLVRMPKQAPIDTRIPTRQQQLLERQVKAGY